MQIIISHLVSDDDEPNPLQRIAEIKSEPFDDDREIRLHNDSFNQSRTDHQERMLFN